MPRILIVDDNKSTRLFFRALLENDGFDTLQCQNGAEALDTMNNERVDLAVVDIMMPGMDGYQLTKELRLISPELPVLMVSARQTPQDRRMGFLAGVDDYITKPIDEEEFLLRIKALLRRARIYSERRITFSGVTLDHDSLTVTKGDETITLPQKEFMLLFKLLSFPGKIFTRIELMDEIWGEDCETGWETVTVHIGRLRRRFEDWKEFDLVSVRGLGYKAVRNP